MRDTGIIYCFHFLPLVKGKAAQCPSLRACHCSCTGFSFNPLSTSATQLLPTAIYYRKIGRFQGVSQFALALNEQAGYLHSFPLHGRGCGLSSIWLCESCKAAMTDSSGGGERNRCFSKAKRRIAAVPLVDPQASSPEAYRLTSVKA